MKILVVKQLDNTLKAAYDSDYKVVKKLKIGEVVECEIRKKRNIKFHKKYMALLNLAFENYSTNMDFDEFRKEIIKRAGYYKEVVNFKGNIEYIALSISFAKMDEIEFSELYSKSIDVILKYVLKGNTKKEIEENIINFM